MEVLKTANRLQIEPRMEASGRTMKVLKPHHLLQAIVEERQRAGQIRTDMSPEDIAATLYGCILGVLYSWCLPHVTFACGKRSGSAFA